MDERKRKKWTPVEQPDDNTLKLREKRKWQIALRRYVIEKNKCVQYAPYFGLDIEKFREWIASQFGSTLSWDNFSEKWQLDHVIPVTYFDFSNMEDLRLCWNFMNIRVNNLVEEAFRSDLLTAKGYFQSLFAKTSLSICRDYIQKIDSIAAEQAVQSVNAISFLEKNRELLDNLMDFSAHDYQQLNEGVAMEELIAEKTLLKNFG